MRFGWSRSSVMLPRSTLPASRDKPVSTPDPTRTIRMLFLPREPFPTDRVRINTLFGQVLLARGHAIDLVMQAADSTIKPGPLSWHQRTVYVGATDGGEGILHRIRKHVLGIK